jgi:hypothetical protein
MAHYSLRALLIAVAVASVFAMLVTQAGLHNAAALTVYLVGSWFCLRGLYHCKSGSESMFWTILTLGTFALSIIISGILESAVF